MECAVRRQQDHAAVIPLCRDLVADPIRKATREGPDGGVAGDGLGLRPKSPLADETLSFAPNDLRFPGPTQFRVLVLQTGIQPSTSVCRTTVRVGSVGR